MEISEKTLWDKCFESMSEDEYCSTTLERLNHIFHGYLLKKAAAYDRLMSGGKKTLKEWANFLGLCVSINQGGVVFCSYSKPMRVHNGWLLAVDKRPRLIIPMEFIYYTGDWKDSLTLPDGWEEV